MLFIQSYTYFNQSYVVNLFLPYTMCKLTLMLWDETLRRINKKPFCKSFQAFCKYVRTIQNFFSCKKKHSTQALKWFTSYQNTLIPQRTQYHTTNILTFNYGNVKLWLKTSKNFTHIYKCLNAILWVVQSLNWSQSGFLVKRTTFTNIAMVVFLLQ